MQKTQNPISLPEFMTVWQKCLHVIDVLVMEQGYEALTAENICKRAGLPLNAIQIYFGDMETLLKMYEGIILLQQLSDIQSGQQKLN